MLLRSGTCTGSAKTRGRKVSRETVRGNPVEIAIREKLMACFNPDYLRVTNDSHLYNAPRGSENRFRVTIVSDKFENVALLDRHRMVAVYLRDELRDVLSFSLFARTPQQWKEQRGAKTGTKSRGGQK